ncbi:4944_t:CDS:2, partial [Funneliformis caledonium]
VKQNSMLQEISTSQEIKNTLIINTYQESHDDTNDKNVNIDSQASIPSNNFISSNKYRNDYQYLAKTIQNGQSSLIEEKFDGNNHQVTILVQTEEPLVTIQTRESLMEELLDTDSEETEDPFELKI